MLRARVNWSVPNCILIIFMFTLLVERYSLNVKCFQSDARISNQDKVITLTSESENSINRYLKKI